MFKADYEGKSDPYEDPFAAALRDEMANYTNPSQGSVAPTERQPTEYPTLEPMPYRSPDDQTNGPSQLGYTNPETPRPYEGNDVTGGNPPAIGETAPGASYAPVLGWDTGKLNSQEAQSPKYQFLRAMQDAGLDPITATNNPAGVAAAINKKFPGLGVTANNDGTINWPGLGPIDYSIDSGKGGWFFDPVNQRTTTGNAQASKATSTFGNKDQGFGVGGDLINSLVSRLLGGGGIFAGLPSGMSQGSQDPFRATLMDSLSKLIQEGQTPVGDVSNTPQARAFQLASTRNADKQRSRLAEQRGSQGLLRSGAFEQDKNAVDQQRSMAQSGYEAQLANTILEDRKQKLQYALSTGAGFITQEQQLELQRELQGINAALAQTSIQLQLAQALLGNQRFYDELGLRVGQTEAGLNQSAGQNVLNP